MFFYEKFKARVHEHNAVHRVQCTSALVFKMPVKRDECDETLLKNFRQKSYSNTIKLFQHPYLQWWNIYK